MVVDDVSLTIDAGTSLALIGASGSGKTTISLAVAGVGVVTSGSIRVIDEEIMPLDAAGCAAGGATCR